jgi:hypothetical protein
MKKYSTIVASVLAMLIGLVACSEPLEGPGAKPPAPKAPSLTAGKGSLIVTLNAFPLTTSHSLYYSTEAEAPAEPVQTGIDGTSTTIPGLTNGMTYYVWVQALNKHGFSPLGERASMTLILPPPDAPVLRAGNESLTMNWTAVALADSYNVYYDTSQTPPATPAKTGITETSTTITGLTNNTYYVWIEAVNSGGKTMGASASATVADGSYMVYDTATLTSAITAINASTTVNGTHIIVLSDSFSNGNVTFSSNVAKTVTIRGDSMNRTISNSGSKELFTVPSGITLTLGNNATLNGNSKSYSVVRIASGGKFIMNEGSKVTGANSSGIRVEDGTCIINGGTITGNTATASSTTDSWGGGIYVSGGNLTMNGGTITGNTTVTSSSSNDNACGGGVFVRNGTFTMTGGTITGNTASSPYYNHSNGGGVNIATNGTFTMTGGTITGNTASSSNSSQGGGVLVDGNNGGTFIKTGGTIDATNSAMYGKVVGVWDRSKQRNTTAGPGVNLDSRVSGSAGGWE